MDLQVYTRMHISPSIYLPYHAHIYQLIQKGKALQAAVETDGVSNPFLPESLIVG